MSPSRALLLCAAIAVAGAGCDAGGLLVVTDLGGTDAGPVADGGPSVTEMVSGGTVVSNDKFKLVFTMGQPTPNQGPSTSTNNRDNGGLVGAMNGK